MIMMTDDHFHLDSLNEFTMELTVAGFEPVDGSRPLRWRGRIHPAFSSLTDAAMMDVVIRPGWPFQSPAVVVEGLNTNHSTLGGYVCMWHDDDSSLEWDHRRWLVFSDRRVVRKRKERVGERSSRPGRFPELQT